MILENLTQAGPVVVTRNGAPLFVAQEATPEWLEAWAAETDGEGDMLLADYAELYGLKLDSDVYRQEFPEDAAHTFPSQELQQLS